LLSKVQSSESPDVKELAASIDATSMKNVFAIFAKNSTQSEA